MASTLDPWQEAGPLDIAVDHAFHPVDAIKRDLGTFIHPRHKSFSPLDMSSTFTMGPQGFPRLGGPTPKRTKESQPSSVHRPVTRSHTHHHQISPFGQVQFPHQPVAIPQWFNQPTPQPRRRNMPYGRRTRYRRPSRRRGSRRVSYHSRNLQSAMSASRVGPATARTAAYAEIKIHQKSESGITTATGVKDLTIIAQGATATTRVGAQVKSVSLKFNYIVLPTATMTKDSVFTWRLTVFQWRPNSKTPPVVADLFDQGVIGNVALSPFNIRRKPLFKIMYDVTGTIAGDPASNTVGGSTTGVVHSVLHAPKRVIEFEDSSGVLGDEGADHVWFIFQSQSTFGTGTGPPTLSYGSKLSFVDS